MARFDFNPLDPKVIEALRTQIADDWNGGDDPDAAWYVVVDDCGPCVIAAFAFNHHARTFVRNSGEPMYVCDGLGQPDDEEAA